MGSVQPLANGDELVGWGSQPYISEYSATGHFVMDAVLPRPDLTYRARREAWVGEPLYPPAGAARRSAGGATVYASWNGDTAVRAFRVLGKGATGAFSPLATASKTGFETAIPVPAPSTSFEVQALDANGRVLARSAPFPIR